MTEVHDSADNPTRTRFILALLLNGFLVIIEIIYGLQSHSVALISDAIHNVGDIFSLILSWAAFVLAKRKRSSRYTYGFKNVTILASFINSALIMLAIGAIGWEAIQRLMHPESIHAHTVIYVAILAIIVNAATALLFFETGKNDLNFKTIYLNMAGDAAVSFGVLLAAWIITFTAWYWLDPVASLMIGLVIVLSNWTLFKESSNLILQAAPANIDPAAVLAYLRSVEHIATVHDLHIWALSSTETALSAHIVMKEEGFQKQVLNEAKQGLLKHFNIGHSTLQLEFGTVEDNCDLK